jgi:hypothetical protein
VELSDQSLFVISSRAERVLKMFIFYPQRSGVPLLLGRDYFSSSARKFVSFGTFDWWLFPIEFHLSP